MELKNRIIILLVGAICFHASLSLSQVTSNYRTKVIPIPSDTLTIDSLTIFKSSFKVYCGENKLDTSTYYFNPISRQFYLRKTSCSNNLTLKYRVFPINFEKPVQTVDTSIVFHRMEGEKEFYYHEEQNGLSNFLSGGGIKKSGSISRGISFGNAQDLSVHSSLNLQLNGKIANNMNLLATLTDKNLPIQPEGNTSQLNDFDNVFIQLYGNNYKIIGGDYWLKKPKGYFMNYTKKVQGIYGQYSWNKHWSADIGGALSKGKFGRNVFKGKEGVQGPYLLKGNDNEPFITILSGTEKVYLNGKLLKRGQSLDYTIDYNAAEITFTTRNFITKDARIIVEFQYTDHNYVRSLFAGNISYQKNKFEFWLNYYTEQDAKNQSLQQELSDKDKLLLSKAGDSLNLAQTSSIDSIGYVNNRVTYKLIDSLGQDSVLVHSVNKDSAFYTASFTKVGVGKGNYIFDKFTANGRVYKWVAPIGGIPQGEYAPSRILVAPKRQALITAGASYQMSDQWTIWNEASLSNYNPNTFSKLGNKNNKGFADNLRVTGLFHLGKDSLNPWSILTNLDVEYRNRNFHPIEHYRSTEFNRDWNIRNKQYEGFQLLTNISGELINQKYGSILLKGQNFTFGRDYSGNRGRLQANWNQNGFLANIEGSYLNSRSDNKNTYIRHIAQLSQKWGPIWIGFADNHERNTFRQGDTLLRRDSYQWYEWEVFITNADSTKNRYKLFYKERYDWNSDSSRLIQSAKARSIGASFDWLTSKTSSLSTMASYRRLRITAPSLINQTPDNTFLGKVDYRLHLWKRALTAHTFYKIGSGMERKKEFMYIKVNAGQGIYTWIDYNEDGVKDLNEFEVAQYVDQANYVRVFTPTDDFVRTFSNEFNQTLFWMPDRIWSEKKGILKWMAKFSDQAIFRIQKKVNHSTAQLYNPLARMENDTNLMRLNSTIRNTVYFNRINPVYGAYYQFLKEGGKTLLANGFDARYTQSHLLSLRWNFLKSIILKVELEEGKERSKVDYTQGRDYKIDYKKVEPQLIYQPNTRLRLSLTARYEEKRNDPVFGGEKAYIGDFGFEFRWNQLQKGSLTATVNYVSINYKGDVFNSVAYEMLESLKPGKNFTWSVQFQHNISKHLQINIHYNGRKSEGDRTIHSGGVEVRAFF